MAARWQLWTDDEYERRRFADLAATLRLPSLPAGPPNRLRRVVRIETPGRTYFLKQWQRTQWKNRWTFATTAPRARDDAERERLVASALRSAGHDAPRPVASGRDGAASYFLCAALDGTSCRDLLAQGRDDAALWRAVAQHCGALLAQGFWLPDLAVDHVFARRDGAGCWRLAVLDLHNGRVARAGAVPVRLAVRVLRRFSRSVRDLPVGATRALRFAARLLRAAGLGSDAARAVLGSLPPLATAARYERPGRSAAYAHRNPTRAVRELELLRRVWPGRAGETVLDFPCGTGRLHDWLARSGHEVLGADGALAMLRTARRETATGAPLVQADARCMPFADGAVDGIVLFRFLHHLAPETRAVAIAEACRVARRFVTVSFFHPASAHHVQRLLRRWTGAPPTRFAVTLRRLERDFARHGFVLRAHAAQRPYLRDLWLASFERASDRH